MLGLTRGLIGNSFSMADTKLAERLAELLNMLHGGYHLNSSELSAYFNVSTRTLRRDVFERLSFLDIHTAPSGDWFLNKAKPNKLNHSILNLFAEKSGVRDLFPYFTLELLSTLFDKTNASPYIIKSYEYESHSLTPNKKKFIDLETAIKKSNTVYFSYGEKTYDKVHAYKLVSFEGYWYFAGIHNNKLKSFHISLMKNVWVHSDEFIKDLEIEKEIIEAETVWFGSDEFKVTLKISSSIAHFFIRKKFFPKQTIESRTVHDELIVSTFVVNQQQLFPLVLRWIPHINIIDPPKLRVQFHNQLLNYMDNQKDIYGY